MIQQLVQQIDLATVSILIALFSLLVSAVSALYTIRYYTLERRRYTYDLENSVKRELPVLQIHGVTKKYWFKVGSPSDTDEYPSYGSLVLQSEYKRKESHLLGLGQSKIGMKMGGKWEGYSGQTIRLISTTVDFSVTISNKANVPFFLNGFLTGIRISPKRIGGSTLHGYHEWTAWTHPRQYEATEAFQYISKGSPYSWFIEPIYGKGPLGGPEHLKLESQPLTFRLSDETPEDGSEGPKLDITPGSKRVLNVQLTLKDSGMQFLQNTNYDIEEVIFELWWDGGHTTQHAKVDRFPMLVDYDNPDLSFSAYAMDISWTS